MSEPVILDPYGPAPGQLGDGYLVGTRLAALLKAIGIEPTGDCQCNARAIQMDVNGKKWCAENRSTIVGWMMEEAERRGVPCSRLAAYAILETAIMTAERVEQGSTGG